MRPACDTAVHLGSSPRIGQQGGQQAEGNSSCVLELPSLASRGGELQALQIHVFEKILATVDQ